MTKTLDTSTTKAPECRENRLTYDALAGLSVREAEQKIDRFLDEMRRMTPEERIRASRYSLTRFEYWIYAARFPDEVPTINGEVELIAATLE